MTQMGEWEVGEWVQSACGCVWRESRPEGLMIDTNQPRACDKHGPNHPEAAGTSPQGLGLFPVTYHEQDPR